jgi:hypothetical protein
MVQSNMLQQARATAATARALSPATPRVTASAAQPSPAAVRAISTPSEGEMEKRAREAAARVPGLASGPDPALDKLAAPGADMAALKAYIDARVAAEVARQVGEISKQQEDHLQTRLRRLHMSQQALIKHVRKSKEEDIAEGKRVDKTQLVMYNLFNLASVGAMLGTVAAGFSPVTTALVAGLVPMVNIIHDYVRRSG